MVGQNPQMLVRIAANLEELKRNLAEGKLQIETTTSAMTKLASSFNGDKLVQHAHNVVAAVNEIGGASKLTADEQARVNSVVERALDKYAALGKEAPAAMRALADATRRVEETTEQMPAKVNDWKSSLGGLAGALGVTFSVGAVVAFGRELLSAADKITLLADKTGLTTEQVQRLQYVESQTSVSVEGMVGAIQNLQQRLGDGDVGAVGAMKALGINVEAFLSLNPYDQFVQVATAVGGIEDPTVKASLAADIFGKSWKELGPVLTKTLKDIANQAPVMGANTTAALDRAGDALARFQITVKVWAAEAYNFFGRVMDAQIAAIYRLVGGLYDATARVVELAGKVPGASKVLGDLTENVASLRQTALWYSDAAKAMAIQNSATTESTKKLTPEAIAAGKALRDQVEAYKAASSAAKTHTAATDAHTAATRALKNEIIPAIHYTEGWEGAISSFWQKVKLTIPTLEDLPRPIALTSQALEEMGIKTTVFKDLPDQAKTARVSIDDLSRSISQLAQISGGAFSGIAQSIGTLIGAASTFHDSLQQVRNVDWKNGSTFQGILSTTTGILGMVSAAITAAKAIANLFDRNKGRDLVVDFAANLGGFDALHNALLQGGAAGEALWIKLTQGVGKNNPEQAKQVIAEVQAFLDKLGSTTVSPQITPHVVYPDDYSDQGSDEGGYAARGGIVGRGRILPFRYGGLVPSGTDTVPAMLTPGEIVLNAAQQKRIADAIGGGGGDIVIHHQTVLDGKVIDERIVKVARKDAARGGLKPRVAAGRSY